MRMTSSNKVRLQKVIAEAGIASRRKAEELIVQGRVKVNGKIVTELGFKADENDKILVDNRPINAETHKEYYLINKPKGIISSASDEHNRKTVVDLIPSKNRLYPVGRLDKETTGALILTNDGDFTHKMTHPKYELSKVYRVSIRGRLTPEIKGRLEKGVKIDGVSYQGVLIDDIHYNKEQNRTQFSITLFEGKNRQIRKLMDFFNVPVLKLHRYKIGSLIMEDLKIGEYRVLTKKEVKQLLNEATKG